MATLWSYWKSYSNAEKGATVKLDKEQLTQNEKNAKVAIARNEVQELVPVEMKQQLKDLFPLRFQTSSRCPLMITCDMLY